MKRLGKKPEKANIQTVGKEKSIKALRMVKTDEEAIEKKLNFLQPKLFGLKLGKLNVCGMRKVWVPYSLYELDYYVDRTSMLSKRKNFDKEGKLYFIYDHNEAHQFQFDMEEDTELDFVKIAAFPGNREVLEKSKRPHEVKTDLIEHSKERVLRRIYGVSSDVTLTKETEFYRAAVEIQIDYGKGINYRYAYLDDYGVSNEHMIGLRYRMK